MLQLTTRLTSHEDHIWKEEDDRLRILRNNDPTDPVKSTDRSPDSPELVVGLFDPVTMRPKP
jgi:hypothetical protein